MQLWNRAWYLVIFLVFIIVITGCVDNFQKSVTVITPVNGTAIVFNKSDNGKAYAIPQGTEFFVNLPETRADRSLWHATLSPGLKLLDEGYIGDPKSIRIDIGGTHRWHIQAAETGQQSIHAACYYSDDQLQKIDDYSLILQILPISG